MSAWLDKVRKPVVIEIGAGTHIPSVRFFSESAIHQYGGRVVRINPRESHVPTSLDIELGLSALEALQLIDQKHGVASCRDKRGAASSDTRSAPWTATRTRLGPARTLRWRQRGREARDDDGGEDL